MKRLRIAFSACLALALATPLFVAWDHLVFPFVSPKVLALRGAAVGMLVCWSWMAAGGRVRSPPRVAPTTWALIAFVGSMVLSGVAAAEFETALWDSLSRQMGIATIAACVVVHLGCTSVLDDERAWRRWMDYALLVGLLVSLAGLVQLGVPALRTEGDARPGSTLGAGTTFSAVGLFIVFGVLARGGWGEGWTGRLLVVGGIGTGVATVVLGETRASFVALVLGALAYGLVRIALLDVPRRRAAMRGLAMASLGGAAALGGILTIASLRGAPLVRRLVMTSFADPSAMDRLVAWDVAFEAVRERPLLGVGPGGFARVFDAHYRPELLRHGLEETWFDDAHNLLLNTMAEQGFLGMAVALALFSTVFLMIWKRARAGDLPRHVAAAGTGFLVAHFLHMMLLLQTPTTWLHLTFFLAFVVGAGRSPTTSDAQAAGSRRRRRNVVIAMAVTALASVYVVELEAPMVRANLLTRRAVAQLHSANADPSETMSRAAEIRSPHRAELLRVMAEATTNELRDAPNPPDDALVDSALFVWEQLGFEVPEVRGTIARAGLAAHLERLRHDAAAQREIAADLEVALELSPGRQQLLFALADVRFRQGRLDDAEDRLLEVIADDPGWGAGWLRLAMLYAAAGKYDDAVSLLHQAESEGVRFSAEDAVRRDELLGE